MEVFRFGRVSLDRADSTSPTPVAAMRNRAGALGCLARSLELPTAWRPYCSAPKRREKKCPTRWKKPREGAFCRGAGTVARTMAGWEASGWTGTGLDPGGGVGGGGVGRFEGTGAGAAGEGGGMAVAAAPAAAALAAPVVSPSAGKLPL
jgi:hypothetical protein